MSVLLSIHKSRFTVLPDLRFSSVIRFACLLILVTGTLSCTGSSHLTSQETDANKQPTAPQPAIWPAGFEIVDISSPIDGTLQKAYFRPASASNRPLAVVLHTWSNDYTQRQHSLAEETAARNWNYIHPDFRGQNVQPEGCCSEKALSDIDAAIAFALRETHANPDSVHILGASGGGYATLCHFMKGAQSAASYSAWVPISDLTAWYAESRGRGNKYAGEILACTDSGDILDVEKARSRSPMFMPMPMGKLQHATLNIFAGIHDGYTGSVPITQSLRFYNRVLETHGVPDAKQVSDAEMEYLLRTRTSPDKAAPADSIGSRPVLFQRSRRNIRVAIFEGGHEMVDEAALAQIDWHKRQPRIIMTIGDSNGASEDGWVNQLKTLLPEDTMLNFSISGNTLGFDNLDRPELNTLRNIGRYLEEAVAQAAGRPIDEILINLGTNDSKAVFEDRRHEVPMNLLYLIHQIRQFPLNQVASPHITILTPPPYGPDEIMEPKYHGGAERKIALIPLFEQVAHGSGSSFIDIHALLAPDYDQLSPDGVHMKAEGQKRIAEAVLRLLGY